MGNNVKIIHIPTTVGGNPQGISRHLNEIGEDSESWTIQQNYFGYPADKVIVDKNDNLFVAEFKKIWSLRYVFMCDVVFFNYGSTLFKPPPLNQISGQQLRNFVLRCYISYVTLMQRIELGLLKFLKKPMLIQYQGDDARQGDFCLSHFSITAATQVEDNYYSPAYDALKREQITLLHKYCHKTYALNPDLLHILPKDAEFLPYSHISLSEWLPVFSQLESRPLRIGHAPSHRGVKGTDLILSAVEQLRKEDYVFEFILIEGVSNNEAMQSYKTIDILIDQLFAGWYGGLAVECMALGKPVMAYIREEDLGFIPEQMRSDLPIINVTPDSVEQTLREVIQMSRDTLYKLAQRSRLFVEKWHDPVRIAQRIKNDMENALSEAKR